MTIECPKCHTENPDSQKFCGECATPLPGIQDAIHTKTLETPTEELTRGSVFAGRYEIIEELGSGGMGKVYRVEDKKIEQEIALKLIKHEIAADKKIIERFRNELKTTRMISHRNVCRMFDLSDAEGTHFITMEYVPGEDLKGLIRRVRIDIGTAIKIAKQVCDGLAEAHRLGVVHRDLKPSNIMIDKEGNARIMDFGIARSLSTMGLTGEGIIIGTPEYMSPEQTEVKEVDLRSDIYSLGVILYEMSTGQLPFKGETPLSIAMKHKGETPINPKELNPQILEDFNNLILKCLEKDKESRYQSAEELYDTLDNIEKGVPTTQREIAKRKSITLKEITVTFGSKKLFILAMAFLTLVVIAVFFIKLLPRKGAVPTPSKEASLAVLSFEDLSPEKDYEHLCDGIAETLLNALSSIENLRVPARTSAFSFKGKDTDVREIGQKLNVETVLEGSVQVAGNKLRVTARLSNTEDGYQLWSESYNREFDDIFVIQDDIAQNIVSILKIKLLGEKKQALVKPHTENSEAYQLYLKGRYFWNKRTEGSLKRALDYFKEAIEEDPTYAFAHCALADSYMTLGSWGVIAPKVAFARAREATMKALELDDLLAEAHSALAGIKSDFEWDWEGAERGFKRAIELNPSYASTHQWYGEYLTYMGRFDEAIAEFKRAQELDPLSLIINAAMGWVYYFEGRYDQSIQKCQKTLEMDPNFYPANIYLGWNYIAKGMYNEAIEVSQKAIAISGGSVLGVSALIISYAGLSMPDKAQEALDSLIEKSKKEYVSPFHIAMTYSALKEKDKAFEWLEKSYEEHFVKTVFLKYGRWFDSLRSDPRFKAFLKKVNLE